MTRKSDLLLPFLSPTKSAIRNTIEQVQLHNDAILVNITDDNTIMFKVSFYFAV